MLWMHYLVGISHFAKYATNRLSFKVSALFTLREIGFIFAYSKGREYNL